jgi:hypothetical protein
MNHRNRRVGFLSVAALLVGGVVAIPSVPLARAEDAPASQPVRAEPVDFRKLKTYLPETVGELPRTNAEGTRSSMGDMKITNAEGIYGTEEGESSANVTIVDFGASPEMVTGMAYWAQVEIDNESDTDYQRTLKVAGFPALEEYNSEEKRGQIMVLVAGRFMVSVSIEQLAPETLQATLTAMKLEALAAEK